VQGTQGAELVPNLDLKRVDKVLEKGQDPRLEMYSAFYPPLSNPRVGDSGLAGMLRESGITDVFVVGLAADYCVGSTAEDAKREGFNTVIVDEATRAVDPVKWAKDKGGLEELNGVKLVKMDGPEVKKVKHLA